MPIHDWTRVRPTMCHDFHCSWITHLKEALNGGLLPKSYYAAAEQPAGQVIPDVLALQMSDDDAFFSDEPDAALEAVAVAEAPPQVAFTSQSDADLCVDLQRTLVIRHSSGDRVIALVEVISPGNKISRMALDDFLRKAASALKQGIHLLIIDLFPPGNHDPNGIHGALWEYIEGGSFEQLNKSPLTLAAYSSGVTRTAYIEPVAVGDALPEMPLFLAPEHYINVPLEETYQQSWTGFPAQWKRLIESE